MIFNLLKALPNARLNISKQTKQLINLCINNDLNKNSKRSLKSLSTKNETSTSKETIIKKGSKLFASLIGGLILGTTFFYLVYKNRAKKNIDPIAVQINNQIDKNNPDANNPDLNILIKFDLNEVYEKTAVKFLSNPELLRIIGLPIKITSTGSDSDNVRSIDLKRLGTDLFTFLSYDLIGSKNSGNVYAKLKWNKSTKEFLMESMILKLNKPDEKNRREIILKITENEPKKE